MEAKTQFYYWRKKNKLTAEDIRSIIDVEPRYVKKLDNGQVFLRPHEKEALIRFTGYPMDASSIEIENLCTNYLRPIIVTLLNKYGGSDLIPSTTFEWAYNNVNLVFLKFFKVKCPRTLFGDAIHELAEDGTLYFLDVGERQRAMVVKKDLLGALPSHINSYIEYLYI